MSGLVRTKLLALSMSAFALAASEVPALADIVMDWNAKADAIAADKQLGALPHGRNIAVLHTAIFEAVNAVEGRYTPYRLRLKTRPTASKDAAAASAGHDVLVALYPDRKQDLDETMARMLADIDQKQGKEDGIELGKRAASGMLDDRLDDGLESQETYRPHAMPGIYVPTAIPLFSNAGRMKPWVMTAGSQFRPTPPPPLTSDTWVRDYNEVRTLGRQNSTVRTPEQTDIGRFWILTGARTFNPLLRQVATRQKMDLLEGARLYALATMASVIRPLLSSCGLAHRSPEDRVGWAAKADLTPHQSLIFTMLHRVDGVKTASIYGALLMAEKASAVRLWLGMGVAPARGP